MSSLAQQISIIGTFYAGLQALILLLLPRINNAGKILGFWCLLLIFGFSKITINIAFANEFIIRVISVGHFVPACFGSLLYLYCRYCLIPCKSSWYDLLHFSPLVLVYLLNIDTLSSSTEQIRAYLTNSPPQHIGFKLSEIVMFLQAVFYIFASFMLVTKYRRNAKNSLSDYHPDIFTWLLVLTALNAIIWALKLLPYVSSLALVSNDLSNVLILLFVSSITIAQWHDQNLFKLSKIEESTQPAEKESSSNLDSSSQKALAKHLEELMAKTQIYKTPDLSLTKLSQELGCSTHQLSETLNQELGTNFYDFINQQRIDHVKTIFANAPKSKILDASLEAGFSTKSTFNIAFKKHVGCTPSQYRKTLN